MSTLSSLVISLQCDVVVVSNSNTRNILSLSYFCTAHLRGLHHIRGSGPTQIPLPRLLEGVWKSGAVLGENPESRKDCSLHEITSIYQISYQRTIGHFRWIERKQHLSFFLYAE
jgi:hypothetical protein